MDRQRQTIELLQLLDEDVAEKVLARLPPDKAARLRASMSKSPSENLLRATQQRALLDDFDQFFRFARTAISLGSSLSSGRSGDESGSQPEIGDGDAGAGAVAFRLTGEPVTDLQSLSTYQLAQALETEQSRTTAILMSHLPPKLAADTLSLMKEDYRRSVVKELSREQHAPQILVDRIARATLQRGATLSSEPPDRRDHADRLADVLRSVPRSYRMSMLSAIEEEDAELNAALLRKMYRFEDLLTLDPRMMQRILGEVDTTTLTTSLFEAPQELKDAVLGNLSRRARQSIEEEMQFQTRVPESRVLQARQTVAELIARIDQESE